MEFFKYKKEIFFTIFILVLFLLASYFSQLYSTELITLITRLGRFGMLWYVVLATIATIIAPVSFLPLLPVAVAIWGSFATAVLSILAWSIGAGIAFLLARRFGKPLVSHFVGDDKMNIFSKLIPQKYMFVAIVILRVALPVDVLSYALGLFGVVRFKLYILATVIGITPFAFIFSYIVQVNIWYQVLLFAFGLLFIAGSFPYVKKRYTKLFLETQ